MVERQPWLNALSWVLLALGLLTVCFPVYYTFVASTHTLDRISSAPLPLLPGMELWTNLQSAWERLPLGRQLLNSLIVALGITVGKISISLLSAFAIVYFKFPFRKWSFWVIFLTLMLPVEVRILPTYEVAADLFSPIQKISNFLGFEFSFQLSLLDSYSGLTLPLIASATATFLFRQFFLTIPEELCEASKIDGASPWQFFTKILLPLSKTNIAALVVIIFVYGWNQFLWPLLITTDPSMKTALIGIQELIPSADEAPEWNVAMAGSLLTIVPPILLVIFMQKWFVKGLIENEK